MRSHALLLVAPALLGCRTQDDATRIAQAVRSRDGAALLALIDAGHSPCDAGRALAWMRGPDLVEAHRRVVSLEACPWEVRAEAAWRIAEETPPAHALAVEVLTGMLGRPERELRWNAAKALGLRKEAAARPRLEACRSDADAFVAAWCAWGSCVIGGPGNCREPNMDLTEGKTGP